METTMDGPMDEQHGLTDAEHGFIHFQRPQSSATKV